jgi:hypothetical protein
MSARFKWSATLVAAGLGGLALTAHEACANEPGTVHYPDLQTLPPYNFKIQNDPAAHRKLLRFSNAIANLGEGPLELVPQNNATTGTTEAYQYGVVSTADPDNLINEGGGGAESNNGAAVKVRIKGTKVTVLR